MGANVSFSFESDMIQVQPPMENIKKKARRRSTERSVASHQGSCGDKDFQKHTGEGDRALLGAILESKTAA